MLRPIPQKILKHNIVLGVCSGLDIWQNPNTMDYPISHVCMQPSNETRKTKDNTEVVLRSLCFVDCKRSSPSEDINALQKQSEAHGKPLTLTFNGSTYTVLTVETLYDDEGALHHYELGLV